jgi:hypothetical protein
MIRAKFVCDEVVAKAGHGGAQLYTAKFKPVVSGSEENKEFFKYTPYGVIELGAYTIKDQFIPGVEYYIDFTAAVPV